MNTGIYWTIKVALVVHLRFHSCERLPRSFVPQCLMRTSVLQIHSLISRLCPQEHRQILIMDHGIGYFDDNPLFFIFASQFYCRLYGIVNSLIPTPLQRYLNSLEVYSTPLFDLRTLIFFFVWFYKRFLNFWNRLKTSFLAFKKYIHVLLEKSSINVT